MASAQGCSAGGLPWLLRALRQRPSPGLAAWGWRAKRGQEGRKFGTGTRASCRVFVSIRGDTAGDALRSPSQID